METTVETGQGTALQVAGNRPAVIGRALQAAASVASTDKVRPMLAAVRVRVGGDLVVIESTDSYRLLSVAVAVEYGGPCWSAVIDSKQAASVGATLAKVKNRPVMIESAGDVVRFTGDGFGLAAFTVTDDNGSRFPDLDSLIVHNETTQTGAERWPGADRETVSMNPELFAETLLAVHKVLAAKRSDLTGVKVHNVSPSYAWRVTGAGENVTVTALVMPLRK